LNVLILGGTQFVGQHIVESLHAAGHTVSVLTRGQTADELPAVIERLRGDRDAGAAGLSALQGRTWDACIDVSGYTPRQVRPSVERLRTCVQRYVFISAVSVYGDPQERPVRETHPRVEAAGDDVSELNQTTYGQAKVACEDIVTHACGPRCTILRPQVVAGEHDPLDRYSYWVRRALQGGAMLAPGDGSDHVQVIDARDLARFVCTVVEHDLAGTFNVSGPRLTWSEFLGVLGAERPVWLDADAIRAAGVSEFELPLFRPERGPRSGLMDVCNARALAAGLTLHDAAETAQHARSWIGRCRLAPALTPQREAELLRAAGRA
jgi:2'-hydroxyisoflavone reductase